MRFICFAPLVVWDTYTHISLNGWFALLNASLPTASVRPATHRIDPANRLANFLLRKR
jgi:hypothetical protein